MWAYEEHIALLRVNGFQSSFACHVNTTGSSQEGVEGTRIMRASQGQMTICDDGYARDIIRGVGVNNFFGCFAPG
jgi:hypothetical protein